MLNGRFVPYLLFWTFICSRVIGHSAEAPPAVRELIQHADTRANIEFCGAVSTSNVDYYLFLLKRKELAGIVLVQQRAGATPVIVDADTSLLPFRDDSAGSVQKPVQNAIEVLLRKRSIMKNGRVPQLVSGLDPEISAIGREIDQVIYPISGFRLGSNSTHEILRLLRTGPTVAVEPENRPAWVDHSQSNAVLSIGPIYLGHAGIVGSDGSIYSADARYGGARTKNFSLASWLRQFSGANGTYAFRYPRPISGKNAPGL